MTPNPADFVVPEHEVVETEHKELPIEGDLVHDGGFRRRRNLATSDDYYDDTVDWDDGTTILV